MKIPNKLLVLKSLTLMLFLALVFVGKSDAAGQINKALLCKIDCAKSSSSMQQSCSANFNNKKSKDYHNTYTLISCVQALEKKVNSCELRCTKFSKTLIK